MSELSTAFDTAVVVGRRVRMRPQLANVAHVEILTERGFGSTMFTARQGWRNGCSNQRRTPATAYNTLPKDQPHSNNDPLWRIRHHRVDPTGRVSLRRAGRMHHIGLGRAHTGQRAVLIIDNLDLSVLNAATEESKAAAAAGCSCAPPKATRDDRR